MGNHDNNSAGGRNQNPRCPHFNTGTGGLLGLAWHHMLETLNLLPAGEWVSI